MKWMLFLIMFMVLVSSITFAHLNTSNINQVFFDICNQNISKEYDYLYFNESPTDSMYPTINNTSIALIEKVDKDTELKVGDIISFKVSESRGCYWVHRIIGIKEDSIGVYYVTKGDNNLFSDFFQKTRREDIYYKITQIK